MAHERLSTILIGGAAALIVCVLICPIWAGEDLHNLVAGNIENLGTFLEGTISAIFSLDGMAHNMTLGLHGPFATWRSQVFRRSCWTSVQMKLD